MGLFKVFAIIFTPIAGMTYASFSLGSQLPKASRKFGNYLGLSYVYFKCILKALKPENQMTYEMIEMARKASQQSTALKNQLRNVVKRAKDDFKKRQEEALDGINDQIKEKARIMNTSTELENQENLDQSDGGHILLEVQAQRRQMIEKKLAKVKANKFFQQL